MQVKAAIVGKHELVTICVGVFAAQAVICAEAPSLHQGKSPVDPWQDNVCGHLADDAWIVPIAGQSPIGSCSSVNGPLLHAWHLAFTKSFNRRGGIAGDHGQTEDAARTCIEIFGMLASWLGLIGIAIDDLDGPDDEDFAGIAGLEECIALAESDFRLIDFDNSFQWFAIRIDHRSPQFLRQQPSGLVGDAKLVLKLPRRHADWRCVVMRCAAQNHAVSGSLERCIAVPAVIEVCRPHSRHSYKRGRLFSAAMRRLSQTGQTKPSGQRCLNKNATQLVSSGNSFWNSESERALAIGVRPSDRARPVTQDTRSSAKSPFPRVNESVSPLQPLINMR